MSHCHSGWQHCCGREWPNTGGQRGVDAQTEQLLLHDVLLTIAVGVDGLLWAALEAYDWMWKYALRRRERKSLRCSYQLIACFSILVKSLAGSTSSLEIASNCLLDSSEECCQRCRLVVSMEESSFGERSPLGLGA